MKHFPMVPLACVAVAVLAILGAPAGLADGAQLPPQFIAQPVQPLPGYPVDGRLRYRLALSPGRWDELHTDQWSLPPDVQAGIQTSLADGLRKTGYCLVVDRDTLPAVADTTANKLTVIGTGGYIVTTNVIAFRATGGGSTGVSVAGVVTVGQKKDTTSVTLGVRIVDAQTGQPIDTDTVTGIYSSHYSSAPVGLKGKEFGNLEFSTSPPGQALTIALDEVVTHVVTVLAKEPWISLVAAQDRTTGRVIINSGDLDGVTPGLIFDVYRAAQPVLDPLTGRKISEGDQIKVGRIKVVRVEHYAAYADVVDGKDFQARDLVEPEVK